MGDTQDKMIIKENCVIIILDARKGKNKIMMFYLKVKRYSPGGQETLTNMPYNKKETSDKR